MSLPVALPSMNHALFLLVAVGLGFGFGFVLERAGFGRANKLAGQFYLHDMTVFKVMFSAIVTAMLGVLGLSGLGLLDLPALSESALSFTFLWPMVLGGFLLGVGFIVSGYCPGTSVVATASGNLDGLVTVVGVVIGSLVYVEAQPLLGGFHTSGDLGWLYLYDLLGVSPQLLALVVALAAIGCFVGADLVERHFQRAREPDALTPAPSAGSRRLAFGVFGVVAAAGVATLVIPAQQAQATAPPLRSIGADLLARRIFDEPWGLRILDVRGDELCASARVPGSQCVSNDALGEQGLAWASGDQVLVLVGPGAISELPHAVQAYPGEIYVLEGGFIAWSDYALTPPEPLAPDASPAEREEYAFRAGLVSALTGVEQPPPPVSTPTITFTPKKRKGGGGCG
jgi:uncharacterized membrane protein YedE/YeeE